MEKSGYAAVSEIAKQYNEHNDCAVRAVALVCDVDYRLAHKVMKNHGRKDRHRTWNYVTQGAIEWFGFDVERVSVRAKTTRTLGREFRNKPGKYLVFVRGHVFAVVGGRVEDWSKGRLHRIKKVYRVFEKEQV